MKDLKIVFKRALMDTSESIKKNGIIFTVILSILFFMIDKFGGLFYGGLLSIITYFIQMLLLALVAKLANNMVIANRVPINDIFYNIQPYFFNVTNTYFVLYVVELVFNMLTMIFMPRSNLASATNFALISIAIMFIVDNILLSSIFEAVYLESLGGLAAFRRAFQFLKENFVIWMIISLPYILLKTLDYRFLGAIFQVPVWADILKALIMPTILVFRGKAYLILSQSTKRKREFMNEYY